MQANHYSGPPSVVATPASNTSRAAGSGGRWALSMALIYGAFIAAMMFGQSFLSQSVVAGVPLCLIAGPGVIVAGILLALAHYRALYRRNAAARAA